MNQKLAHFLSGLGAVLVIAPTSGRANFIDAQDILHDSDVEALYSDWKIVGNELFRASNQVAAQNKATEPKKH